MFEIPYFLKQESSKVTGKSEGARFPTEEEE